MQPDGSKRPAMGSLCWYPMGKLRMQRSGQDAAGAKLRKNERTRAATGAAADPAGGLLAPVSRASEPPGSGGRRIQRGLAEKAMQGKRECQALGLPCMP